MPEDPPASHVDEEDRGVALKSPAPDSVPAASASIIVAGSDPASAEGKVSWVPRV